MYVEAGDPTLADAMKQLGEDLAADAPTPAPAEVVPAKESAPEPGERTPEAPTPEVQPPAPDSKPGTPATEVPPKEPAAQAGKEPSRFEKNQQRLQGGWKELNQGKDELRTAKADYEQKVKEFQAKETAFKEQQTKASQPKYQPADYETHADKCELEARRMEELGGDLEKITELKIDAKRARQYAKQLRDNPPPVDKTEEQKQAEHATLQKEWWGKAAVDFPAIIKEGSPEKAALEQLIKSEPSVTNDPKGMYYGARLVVAETSAARVPTLVKELETANAKIKELNEKLTIPADGAVNGAPQGEVPFNQKSDDQQYAELEREAQSVGYIN